jgi:adenosylhomocysteinase
MAAARASSTVSSATDVMLAGKLAVVCGFGNVGKGSAASLRSQGTRVMVTEIDPIYALQAAMEGYQVTTMDAAAAQGDIFVTATGNIDVITIDHMHEGPRDRLQHRPFRQRDPDRRAAQLSLGGGQAAGRRDRLSRRQVADRAGQGTAVNLGCATGHPSFVMSASFTNQVLAQIELWTNHGKYENIYVLPNHLDEKVAALHLDKLGVKLTSLSGAQANYLALPRSGPFKPEHYRY